MSSRIRWCRLLRCFCGRRGVCAGLGAPAPTFWALRPKPRKFVRGREPQRLLMQALRPAPGSLCGAGGPYDPPFWALRPKPRVTFSPMRKSPKNLPEGAPLWVLPKGDASLPLRRCRNPLDRVSASNSDRFATLRWVGESVFFSPQALPGVTLPAFKPWRAGWGEPMVRVASAWQVGQTGGSCSLQSGWGAQAADSFSLIQQKNCWMPGGQYRPYIAARTDWVRALPI